MITTMTTTNSQSENRQGASTPDASAMMLVAMGKVTDQVSQVVSEVVVPAAERGRLCAEFDAYELLAGTNDFSAKQRDEVEWLMPAITLALNGLGYLVATKRDPQKRAYTVYIMWSPTPPPGYTPDGSPE